ncbi:superinfection exclusion B family protein [Paenibacillus sp. FSL K6-2524]|uniref:superinfection exclusion B family protein n=1 Tax=Paenibacillus sp. FSL K6-2524 TaxID=2954516 RepID=UPI0030FAC6B3
MEAIITKILGVAKYTNKFFIIVAVGSAILLFSPKTLIDNLGLLQFVNVNKQYIGMAFLVSGVVTVANLITFIHKKVIRSIRSKRWLKRHQERLHSLNAMEKRILLYYFVNGTNTQLLAYNDGTVGELAGYKIIQRASNLSHMGARFPYNLNPWAREYLIKNPQLLKTDDIESALIQREIDREKWEW